MLFVVQFALTSAELQQFYSKRSAHALAHRLLNSHEMRRFLAMCLQGRRTEL